MRKPCFQCAKCGEPFASYQVRDVHQEVCVAATFKTNPEKFVIPPHLRLPPKEPPTYRSLLEKAAQADPQYEKYVGRINYGEPNDMTTILAKMKKGKGWRDYPKNAALPQTQSEPVTLERQ